MINSKNPQTITDKLAEYSFINVYITHFYFQIIIIKIYIQISKSHPKKDHKSQ